MGVGGVGRFHDEARWTSIMVFGFVAALAGCDERELDASRPDADGMTGGGSTVGEGESTGGENGSVCRDGTDLCGVECDVDTCSASCSSEEGCGPYACGDASVCDVSCSSDASCRAIDCAGADTCDVECSGQASCGVDCGSSASCGVVCSGNSQCRIDCAQVEACDQVRCEGRARCRLDCSESASCEFEVCEAPVMCPDGTVACNLDCPK